jgi:predicted DNA-binding protein YlxM (UPF0122 family)
MARPQITDENKKIIVQKLEPYLKAGLSLRKACFQAQVSRSTVYYLIGKDEWFLNQINLFRQYLSVLLTSSIARQLYDIVQKQNREEGLSILDLKFLFWVALNSNQTKEEFGRKQNVLDYDPELEIQRILHLIGEMTSKEPHQISTL